MTTYGTYGNNFQFLMTMVAILIDYFFIFGREAVRRGKGAIFIGGNFLGNNFQGVNFHWGRKFNTELFCTYNHERTYYHHSYNHMSANTKYLFSGLNFEIIFARVSGISKAWIYWINAAFKYLDCRHHQRVSSDRLNMNRRNPSHYLP